jgi:hypothetical protein
VSRVGDRAAQGATIAACTVACAPSITSARPRTESAPVPRLPFRAVTTSSFPQTTGARPRPLHGAVAASRALRATESFREARSVWTVAVVGVMLAAVVASLRAGNPASGFDAPVATHPFTGMPFAELLDLVFSALARWDATWYLIIANDGYVGGGGPPLGPQDAQVGSEPRAAFFPLFPLFARLLSLNAIDPGATLIAAYVVAWASFLVALVLLHRLVTLETGRPAVARATLVLLAASPLAFYFIAPYTESLFLALVVGAFYAARTGHWTWAGALAGLAGASRSPGIALIGPLLFVYLYGPRTDRPAAAVRSGLRALLPRYGLRKDVLWLALAPSGIVLYSLYLARARGDALLWLNNQSDDGPWAHSFFPFQAVWQGLEYGWNTITLFAAQDPVATAPRADDVLNFAALLLLLVAIVGIARRLPFAYVVMTLALVSVPLSAPSIGEPLKSFARYGTIAFPVFIWLALVLEKRGWTMRVAAGSAVLLGVLVTGYAQWQWVA